MTYGLHHSKIFQIMTLREWPDKILLGFNVGNNVKMKSLLMKWKKLTFGFQSQRKLLEIFLCLNIIQNLSEVEKSYFPLGLSHPKEQQAACRRLIRVWPGDKGDSITVKRAGLLAGDTFGFEPQLLY